MVEMEGGLAVGTFCQKIFSLPRSLHLSYLSVFLSLIQMSFDKAAVLEISACVIGLHLGP